MTEIIVKSTLDKQQKDTLMLLLKSWNIDAEVKTSRSNVRKSKQDFSLSVGIWKDRNLDAKDIRKQAWKLGK